MTKEVSELLERALALPPEGRAALATSLLDSLDTTVDESASAAWDEEISRRVVELDSKKISPVPWSEVRKRLLKNVR